MLARQTIPSKGDATRQGTLHKPGPLLVDELRRRRRQGNRANRTLVLRVVLLNESRGALTSPPLSWPDVTGIRALRFFGEQSDDQGARDANAVVPEVK